MRKKDRNAIIVLIAAAVVVFLMFYANSQDSFIRQLQGPTEGTNGVLTVGDKLFAISKDNHVFTWLWNDFKKWPIVARPAAIAITPFTDDKIVYIPSNALGKIVITNLKADKELATLTLPYGAEYKKIKMSPSGKFGIVSMLGEEGSQKNWFKLAVFDSDLKNMSFVFQKNTAAEDFQIDDFDISQDGRLLAVAGQKGKGWVFITDTKTGNMLWEKTFNEYNRFTLVRFSPDGKTIFAAEKIRRILCIDISNGEIVGSFEIPEYPTPTHQKENISSIAISPDGRILAADSEPACRVWFWDIKTGKKIASFSTGEAIISSIAFSPDSRYIATGCLVSPEIKIWKVPQLEDNQ